MFPNRGRASRLFAVSTNTFVRLVQCKCLDINFSIRALFCQIYNGHLERCVLPYLTDTYLFCLHKDEKDPTKLWPISVPTAPQRIITNHVAHIYRRQFAVHLLPFNFAVGIDNGMGFFVKASQLEVERYITTPQQEGRMPTQCFIVLDLVNMFNKVSCDRMFDILWSHFLQV